MGMPRGSTERWFGSLAAVAVGLAMGAVLAAAAPGTLHAQDEDTGRIVYERWCMACHGSAGDGLGPAAGTMLPRPRDFTRGLYQIRTTAGGELPTDADILHIIDRGMPGTSMPGWEGLLSSAERQALVTWLKAYYPGFEQFEVPEPLALGRAPRATPERLAEGRDFYERIECWQCHGRSGRGEGTSAPTLSDDWGHPVRALDLTKNWRFTGGGTVEDIYRTLRTGLDGTPMPAFSDLVDAGFMTDDQLWSLAHYVRSLSPETRPPVRDVIRVARVEAGSLPADLDDARWAEAEAFHVPLVAQIITAPRWFDPAVDAVEVRGFHDGSALALHVSWHDRSESPDPTWAEWQNLVLGTLEPHDGDPPEPGPRPDELTVQFPMEIPTGMDRPYFLLGDDRSPVSLWNWSSADPGRATRARGSGPRQVEAVPGGDIAAEARWSEGRWELLLTRALRTDAPDDLQFEEGVAIPVAFQARDGDHGEAGLRASISSWFFVHLEPEVPPTVFVAPVVAMLLSGLLGLLVVKRAQRGADPRPGGAVQPRGVPAPATRSAAPGP
jgi:mono/diheme cytochrome c family protein